MGHISNMIRINSQFARSVKELKKQADELQGLIVTVKDEELRKILLVRWAHLNVLSVQLEEQQNNIFQEMLDFAEVAATRHLRK